MTAAEVGEKNEKGREEALLATIALGQAWESAKTEQRRAEGTFAITPPWDRRQK